MRLGARGVRAAGAVLLCGAALGLTACGGGSDDSDQVSAEQLAESQAVLTVGKQVSLAYRQRDGDKLCALLDPTGLKKRFKSIQGCKRQLAAAMNQPGAVTYAKKFAIDQVKVIDASHAFGLQSDNGSTEVPFKKIGGKWYVDLNPPGADPSGTSD